MIKGASGGIDGRVLQRERLGGMLNYSPLYRRHQPEHSAASQHSSVAGWKDMEDIDLARNSAGQVINVPLPQDQWSVPLTSFSGTFGSNLLESQGHAKSRQNRTEPSILGWEENISSANPSFCSLFIS
jgi:hypothetical protein